MITRLLTPSKPRPTLGQPKPRAMSGGSERGKLEAEKKLMESVRPVVSLAGSSTLLALAAFSGMDRNDGMAYLERISAKRC